MTWHLVNYADDKFKPQQEFLERIHSDNFNIIQVMTVDRGQADSTVVHLSSKNFISKEPVAKNTTVTVRRVEALSSGYIREVREQGVHGTVLLLTIIQVLSMSVN